MGINFYLILLCIILIALPFSSGWLFIVEIIGIITGILGIVLEIISPSERRGK